MRIIELYVENFGRLSAYRETFSPSLNAFCLDNGAGKTTLTVFIKSMLYGLDNTHKQSLSENDRKKYLPWQGGAFGGWLSFEAKGKRYRIERMFAQKASDDTFTLYDLDTGAVSDDFSASLGEELFGIDADGFERTVFISEKKLSEKNDNHTIAAKLSDLVGVDGDIGDFDGAIALLEKRRMFYQKRGGAGEIQSTNNAISELEERIAATDRQAARLAELESEYASLSERSRSLHKSKSELLEKRRENDNKKRRMSIIAQYKSMLSSLSADEERERALLDFFKNKIPTVGEIREAQEQLDEAERLRKTASADINNSEYDGLLHYFATPTTDEECERMARLAERASAVDITSQESVGLPPRSPFVKEPTESEIREYSEISATKNAKKSRHGSGLALIIIGAVVSSLGAALGSIVSSALFAVSAIGILVTAVGIALTASSGIRDTRVRDFIRSVYGDAREDSPELSVLIEMRAALEGYKKDHDEHERRTAAFEAAERERRSAEAELDSFLAKFDTPPTSRTEKIKFIAQKHRRLALLTEQAERSSALTREALARASKLGEYAAKFLSLFETKTSLPLDEIRAYLAEYEALSASLKRRRSEIESFALANGITPASLSEAETEPLAQDTESSILSIDSELLQLEGDISSKKTAMATISRDIENRPALEERLIELTEQRTQYEENLSVIKKAKELLGKAKTNMTARYLGSTTEGFRKYVSFIDGEDCDFTMDTSFAVKKDDMGASRETASYSRGTKELFSLAVHLSLSDALYEEDLPPIILDDPFLSFDDAHTERALSLIKKLSGDRQILYFTCSKARKIK